MDWVDDDFTGRAAPGDAARIAAQDRRRPARGADTVAGRRRGPRRANRVARGAQLGGGARAGRERAVPDRVHHQDLHGRTGDAAARRGHARPRRSVGQASAGHRRGAGHDRPAARAHGRGGGRVPRALVGADPGLAAARAERCTRRAAPAAPRRAAAPLLQHRLHTARRAGGGAARRPLGGGAAPGDPRTARSAPHQCSAAGPARGRLGGASVGRRAAAGAGGGPGPDGVRRPAVVDHGGPGAVRGLPDPW
ncbi:hypothetical protein SGPA1_50230 [Streptomyces misionensis JCM 4497]